MATIKHNPNAHGLPVEWLINEAFKEKEPNNVPPTIRHEPEHDADYYRRLGYSNAMIQDFPNQKKRNECHAWFDKLWKDHEERDIYYHRLAETLGIEYEKCHFALMKGETLDKALEIIKKWWFEKYDK